MEASRASTWDAVIVGGGPAGAAAALLLARRGHRVRVLTRPSRSRIAESLPPSIRRLLAEVDLLDTVESAPFYRCRGNTVWWGSAAARSEPFPDSATGYQVERPKFDRLLLDAAEAAGAVVHRDAAVRGIVLGETAAVRFTAEGGSATARARWVLDCSGRAGVLARHGLRRPEPGHRTLALYGVWERDRWDLPDETHTLVESYREGWGWSVPVSARLRYVTAMMDPHDSGLARGRSLDELYHTELDRTTHFRELVRGASLRTGPQALSASPYSATGFAGPGWFLVGDAASFVDPLSSFGVKKALASGWLAAVAVHTCLTDPLTAGPALELFESREREVYALLARQATELFEEGAAAHAHGFWSARATLEDPEGPPGELDIRALRTDPQVLAALERLRRLPSISLRPAGDVELIARPLVREDRVVLEDHLRSEWTPGGVRYLRGINLPRVLALAPTCSQVPDLYEAYNRSEPWATLPDFIGVLSVLLAKGVLVQAETADD